MEWTVARPSRSISTNLALGKMCDRYARDFRANGSLLQRRGAGSPWPTITCNTWRSSSTVFQQGDVTFNPAEQRLTSNRKALTAESNTWSVTPASSNRILSFTERLQVARMVKRRGITRVSSPHRTCLWASNITRINVVPLLGKPPMKMRGVSSGKCSVKERFWLAEPRLSSIHRWRWLFGGHSMPLMPR